MRALKSVRQHYRSYDLKSGVFHFYRGEHQPAALYFSRALEEADAGEGEIAAADRRAAEYYLVQTRIAAASEFEREGELERALEQYRVALDVMPDYADVHFQLGKALHRMQRYEEAVQSLEQAIRINPRFTEGQVLLGFSQIRLGQRELAAQAFRAARDAQVEQLDRALGSAEQLLLSSQHEQAALEAYRDAFREDLEQFQRAFECGLIALRAEDWDSAAEQMGLCARLRPKFADVHNYLGVALAEGGQPEAAMASFHNAVEINRAYLTAWLNLAYTAYDLGEMAVARRALAAALAQEPDNPPAINLQRQLQPVSTER